MSKDPLDLKKYIRTVDNFPIDGIEFKDITSLIETPKAFVKTCDELTKITKDFGADLVASIESRGFIFAGTIARDLHLPFILARKPGKLPNETYKKRIIQLGENPKNVFNTGGMGIDLINKSKIHSKEKLEKILKIKFKKRIFLITYHPTTLEDNTSKDHIKNILNVLKGFCSTTLVFTFPNADMYGKIIISEIEKFTKKNSNY